MVEHRHRMTADVGLRILKWQLRQVIEFVLDHDIFIPKLTLEYRGVTLGLTLERSPAPDRGRTT